MLEICVENVTQPEHRLVLKELLEGGFSYTPEGEQVNAEEFVLKFGLGEYAVVMDELFTRKREELFRDDWGSHYSEVYRVLPRVSSVEAGDSYVVSL